MRARDFLLEYSREKTAGVFGNKIIAALMVDKRLSDTLMPLRNYLSQKAKIGVELTLGQQQQILDIVMQEIESADPTPNKEYVQWLAKVYANEKVPLEDVISNGADALKNYHQFKIKKMLEPQFRNIMNLTFLQMAMLAHDPDMVAKLNAANDAKADKGEAKVLLDNDQVRIIVPRDETAAKYYGQGTRWCTAAKNNNMYSRYASEGEMYILLPKQPKHDGEKYQLHFESEQFMNEDDDEVNIYEIMYIRFGNLLPIFLQHRPDLGDYVIFSSDKQLQPVLDKIKELGYEWINEWLSDIEADDNEWQEYLMNHTDEDGDVNWDEAGDYLEWNDYAREIYNELEDAMTVSAHRAREIAAIISEQSSDMPKYDELEEIVASNVVWATDEARRRRKNGDIVMRNFSYWIRENIITTAKTARLVTPQDKIR